MARKLLIRREKKIVEQGKEIVIAKQRMYYVADSTKDFHSTDGVFPKKELAKKDGSSTGPKNDFIILSSCFIDDYRRIARLAQIIPLKDLGVIIATTGINKTSKAVDAGAGSGALACMLTHICKEVTTYDIRDDCLDIVKKNKEFLNLKNLKITKKDVYAGIDEKNVDLITLDLPSPWLAIKAAEIALKIGGFLVSYSPSITQAADFVNHLKNHEHFMHLKTIEIAERSWEIDGRKVRPQTKDIGHSGFISFARKL